VAKDPQAAYLFRFYGLVLFSNLVYETSTGVLQAARRFDRLALINTGQSILTAALIFAAFLYRGSAFDVLAAYLLGKTLAGLAVTVLALRELNTCLGGGWQHASLRLLTDWREIAIFAINTNLSGTVNLFVRDNAPMYLGALRPEAVAQTEVGNFKLALSIINLVMLPIEPFIWPTYAEITRTIAQNQWQATRRLLKRVSAIAGLWGLIEGIMILTGASIYSGGTTITGGKLIANNASGSATGTAPKRKVNAMSSIDKMSACTSVASATTMISAAKLMYMLCLTTAIIIRS
jgi:autotransporter-associated beta strand protein